MVDKKSYSVVDLLRVMQRLRDPQAGCPWDLAQDFASIAPSTLEECYELVQAIEDGDVQHLAEELGDVLFQVVFYAQLGAEKDWFTFEAVVHNLVEKLIRRHPHVFAGAELEGEVLSPASVEEVKRSWEAIKRDERHARQESGVLADIPLALPALSRAQKLQKRAAQVNFDWPDSSGVVAKLYEELAELEAALAGGCKDEIGEEVGDLLFTCVNMARHLGFDAERSLRQSSGKFEQRFERMEAMALAAGDQLSGLTDAQLDQLWERAKTG